MDNEEVIKKLESALAIHLQEYQKGNARGTIDALLLCKSLVDSLVPGSTSAKGTFAEICFRTSNFLIEKRDKRFSKDFEQCLRWAVMYAIEALEEDKWDFRGQLVITRIAILQWEIYASASTKENCLIEIDKMIEVYLGGFAERVRYIGEFVHSSEHMIGLSDTIFELKFGDPKRYLQAILDVDTTKLRESNNARGSKLEVERIVELAKAKISVY